MVVDCDIAAKLNFACHQSSFAFLRNLRISNASTSQLENVYVSMSSDPPFLTTRVWRLDRLSPGESIVIRDRDVALDASFLLGLSDAIRGTVHIRAEQDGIIVGEETKPVELLAPNEWGGAGYMPELLAAFATPNDPAVDVVLRNASLVLRKAGKSDGIDGYQSGSRQRVWEIASAVYAAICNLRISYASPPASFERDGQKIRLPASILETRVATCLDSSLLFASAFEQAGLHPLVVLLEGHAMVGVWLQPQGLTTIVLDEAQTLRKSIQLHDLILIETTVVTQATPPAFSRALAIAEERIAPSADSTFQAAVDIVRARAHRITPLGTPLARPTSLKPEEDRPSELDLEEAPPLPGFDVDVDEEDDAGETPVSRLDRWQRKLLDLSARNPLLNHRSARASLPLICPRPAQLEDKLAQGARIALVAVPNAIGGGQDEVLHLQRTGEEIAEVYASDALERNQVLVDLPEVELNRRAIDIYRKAEVALQEGGASTLYLAIGFLLWTPKQKEMRRFRAPLILLPVTLERKSVRSGVRMVASNNDEARFNTTLLEMLRRDFHIEVRGLDGALPTDESGIDVDAVWDTVRRATKDVPGLEVIEDVVLGHFSFAKYLMWRDLVDHADDLRHSRLVRHLVDTPRDPYPGDVEFVNGADIDRLYRPSDLLTPMPADASQMTAVATADRGKDFVIIGPPGTGKSQTIANIIAHCLGQGKTVLFVSAKAAALEVVYRRLQTIGLGRFCLELHSDKASKADVVKKLGSAWQQVPGVADDAWEEHVQELARLRDELNAVVDHLHVKRRNGMTAHYAFGVKVRDAELAGRAFLSWPSADQHDAIQLSSMRKATELLRVQASAAGDVSLSPFKLVAHADWSPQWEARVIQCAERLSKGARELDSAGETMFGAIGITSADQTLARLDALAELALVLLASWRKPVAFALEAGGTDRLEALEEAATRLAAYREIEVSLSCNYAPSAWRVLDGDDIGRRWAAAQGSGWPMGPLARTRIVRDLKANGALGEPDVAHDAGLLKRLRTEGEAIDRLAAILSEFKEWRGEDTPVDVVRSLYDLGAKVRSAVTKLADDAPAITALRKHLSTLLREGNDLLAPDAHVGTVVQEYLRAHQEFQAACDTFEAETGAAVLAAFANQAPAGIQEFADAVTARHADLRNWCNWYRRKKEAQDLGLGPLVEAIEQGRVPVEEIEKTFEAAYCSWWSGAVIDEDEVLRAFSTPEHVAAIAKFQAVDSEFQELTAAYVAARIAGRLPNPSDISRKASWGVLLHELKKKARYKAVRQLLQEIPDVILSLTPCLMMSPLSVAQYLTTGQTLFDVVIVDEASQITVWDAVGSLARGRQVIVAGDPNQLPPTNFFTRSEDDPDGEIDAEGDLESILDEMLGASVPQLGLNLHYRSRRESLIAFSNSRYYENSLVTFPAPVHPDRGIRLIRPDGYYARGSGKCNEGEAKAVVAEVVRRLTHSDPEVRKASIGVVTFNTEQRSLIENLLDEARSRYPDIESAFSREATAEPVFVKNLETVQGDERDVIMFSVTYGPDQNNHVTMNFGPLNQSGGERRLNVALTRARSELLVFSTLSPDRIDVSRTQARAVLDLKNFLEYAERGPASLGVAIDGSRGDVSPFEEAVARGLRKRGWEVRQRVGVSAYRVDLGVVHPDHPSEYLAGVECDGAMYRSSTLARERDKIRQSVLEGLGWTLFRVWSTDWWTNPARALDNLHDALARCLEADVAKRADKTVADLPPSSGTPEPLLTPEAKGAIPEVGASQNPVEEGASTSPVPPEENNITDAVAVRYEVAELEGHFSADPERFYSEDYEPHLQAMIEYVIDVEGPIHEDVLVRRIARHHGFHRAGHQINGIVIRIANRRRGHTQEKVGTFFWPKGNAQERRAPARYQDRDDTMRSVDYICQEELRAIAAATAIIDPVGLARTIGIARLSERARGRLTAALHDLRVANRT